MEYVLKGNHMEYVLRKSQGIYTEEITWNMY